MKSSLYIHIPFCKKKCAYCDFFSVGEADRRGKINDLNDSYISSLLNEAETYTDFYGITEWKTVYVGGGTPSLLSPKQICDLFSGLKKNAPFSEDAEITFEMNPDDVNESLLSALANSGVNRLSMGIQALDDKALKAVERGSSVRIINRALEILQMHWNGRLSVDFIAGLPCHTWKSFENQFGLLKDYPKIDHVSLYTLTVEENTPLYKKIEDRKLNFSSEKADRMWLKGRNILEKMGFMQYEVSNFAKKGFESRHNQVYWKQENYIGIGSGASGTWYDFEKTEALRWTNTLSIPVYVSKCMSRKTESLDAATLEFEFLMLGFRRLSGVRDVDFEMRFGKSLSERIGADKKDGVFFKWQKMGLASVKKTGEATIYALNRRGILLLNRFLEELL